MARPLRILHCFRAPVGGLFRHVCDLARGQAESGYEVGLICDSSTGGPDAESRLRDLEKTCALGVTRLPMARSIGVSDLSVLVETRQIARDLEADVVHGHGAKGGAYARIAAWRKSPVSIYTPHGGSLHYKRSSPAGFLFLALERALLPVTDGLVFESRFGQSAFAEKVASPGDRARVIPNGLHESEFVPVPLDEDASDLLFIGELRHLKGVDLLLHALAACPDRETTALVVGSGPDETAFRDMARELGLADRVTFKSAMPARRAFAKGRILVVPSRAESFPYIVLEAAAAAKPMIATRVGGIPEIFGEDATALVCPDSSEDLGAAIRRDLADESASDARTKRLQERAHRLFPVGTMVEDVTRFYLGLIEQASSRNPQVHPAPLHPPAGKDTA